MFMFIHKFFSGTDYQVFPRIIGEVLTKYNIDELHFSLTQGCVLVICELKYILHVFLVFIYSFIHFFIFFIF